MEDRRSIDPWLMLEVMKLVSQGQLLGELRPALGPQDEEDVGEEGGARHYM